ncbi:YdcF family protein [Deinococcus wulumuqiensis]|uniref:YdcF family protein n=1 Tax=Deinococcus wulumuqiensis TaxID=980427 RepID=UPI001F0869EF|nr:YdcF family protein [Deinococcus wulumuqiensis]
MPEGVPVSPASLSCRSLSPRLRGALLGLLVAGLTLPLLALFGELRATGPLLLTVLGLGGLAGAFSLSRRLLLGGAGVLAGVLAACLLTPVLRGPLSALVVSQPPVKADAIVVLGAGIQCGTGSMNGASLSRLTRGLELWRAGYAPLLTVSEQSGRLGPRDCPKLSALQRAEVAALYGDQGPKLLTLPSVTTTRDEAARVRDLARQNGWRRVLLVTSPWHSRRAQALFRGYGVDAVSVPARETGFDLTLPTPADRLYAFRVLTYEGLSRVKAALGGTPER